jgi:hypothetical protein
MAFNSYAIHPLLRIVEEIVTCRFLHIVAAGCSLILTLGEKDGSTPLIFGGEADEQTAISLRRLIRVERQRSIFYIVDGLLMLFKMSHFLTHLNNEASILLVVLASQTNRN